MPATSFAAQPIADAFADLVDPRVERTKRHSLHDILTITLCGVLSGAENRVEIAAWSVTKQAWLTVWFQLEDGIPSHNTSGRVFDRFNPHRFGKRRTDFPGATSTSSALSEGGSRT